MAATDSTLDAGQQPEPASAARADRAPEGGKESRLRRAVTIVAALGTGAAALWGAISGSIAWSENQAVSVNLSSGAATAYTIVNHDGIGTETLRLAFVNTSARAVSLVRVKVLLGGRPVGEAYNVSIEGSGNQLGTSSTLPLPYALPANDGSALELAWRSEPNATPALLAATNTDQRRMALQVTLEPGGTRLVPVHLGQGPEPLGGWTSWIDVKGTRAAAIMMLPGAGNGESVDATLRIWSANPRDELPVYTATRPAGDHLPGWFGIGSLRPGAYVYSISSGTRVISSGVFRTRCIGEDGEYESHACATGDGRGTFVLPHYPPPGM